MVFITSIILIGLFFLLMSVRLLFLKKGEFKGTCSSNNPLVSGKGDKSCSYCGKEVGSCNND